MRYSMDLSSWKSAELSPADPDNKTGAGFMVRFIHILLGFLLIHLIVCVPAVVPRHWKVLKTVSV